MTKVLPLTLSPSSLFSLRKTHYDLLFDLQGNCKSGVVTGFAKAKKKVGFSFRTAREWPNALMTHYQFNIDRRQNIRHFYLNLISSYFRSSFNFLSIAPISFQLASAERKKVDDLLENSLLQKKAKVFICPGSKWPNKRLSPDTLSTFIQKIGNQFPFAFLYGWGSLEEKNECETLQALFPDRSIVIEKLSLPTLQYLMGLVDCFIGVDSIALHLAATTATPTFSLFGPTRPEVFQPIGAHHLAIHGSCPYKVQFEKQCPYLRKCKTGACIRELEADALFHRFAEWVASKKS